MALVTSPSDEAAEVETIRFRGISSGGNVGAGPLEQLFFALPYNDEQEMIVQRLEHAPGVTVQGPPGTGKTHTIANIICHYLALGRRVLVTSRGEPALEVLQSKIPEEVRPLTVALLSGDREGVRQFQASIETIQHRVSQLSVQQSRLDIETLQEAIGRAHGELTRIDARIDKIAHVQLSEMDVDGVQLRAQQLAELVVAGRAHYGWFDDPVSLTDEHAPPLSDEDARALREARRVLGPDLAYIAATVPSADDLPSVAAVTDLHDVLARIRAIESEVASGELLPLKTTTPELISAARDLLARVDEARLLADELQAVDGGWPLQLRAKCGQPSFGSEREALESLFPEMDILANARAAFLKRPVEFPDEGLVTRRTREAVARGVERGKPFGFMAFGDREAKGHIASVRVAGRAPRGTDDWTHVNRYVVLQEVILSFVVRWNHLAEGLSMPQLRGGISALREIELVANIARNAHRMAMDYDATLPRLAEAVFERTPARALAGTAEELNGVRGQLLRHLAKVELSRATIELTALQEACAGKTGPVSAALRTFITDELGHLAVPTERAAVHYAGLIAELRRIATLSAEFATVRDFAKRIGEAGAPKFASRIAKEPVGADGEDRAFPPTWRAAWNWARMRSFLNSIDARQELLTMAARRRDLEAAISRLYTEVVAKAAWLATKKNAKPKVLQALAGYVTAIRRIGQGTGPNATRHRRDAREAMQDAAGAVPCWIMSHARISEAMPAEIGAFDLVIVDEASQSDLWALPAILRGKKILVVGDDKQVAPDGGFIASQRIQQLRDRFLSGQPYEAEMTPDKSLYELASRAFAAEQVMLREHFRCVPPIIAYSNRTFYKGQIHPLRIPKASERIDPPLVDVYVDGGVRDSRDCNEQEATAVSEEIIALLDDDRFANRTIGVVSLLGIEQAKRIDELVRSQCDPAELLRRRFQCGDARTFQGSERDIMFLSMVVDPANSKALSGNLFDQRFNVAASRARDRMYLVRSVKASDLSERDLRRSLLLHFSKPLVGDQGREGENLIEQCESEFERQIFSALTSRGYRVIPQVRAGDHRIDMVVEGASDTRLAVECDGDDLHGADRWQQDTKRQRVLERAGWTFWRCFSSTWLLRRDDVLGELLERLSVMGIEPLGALERAPCLVERRVWMAQQPGREERDDAGAALEEAVG
jgi:very-short-patch-repair endonuclease